MASSAMAALSADHERDLVAGVEHFGGEDWTSGARALQVGGVEAMVDGVDAGQSFGARGVNRADAGMGLGGAQDARR